MRVPVNNKKTLSVLASRWSITFESLFLCLLGFSTWLHPSFTYAIETIDYGLESRFQDTWDDHHRRGRTSVAADFDLDGRVDFFIGNINDESFVIRNTDNGIGLPRFEVAQILLTGEIAWGGASADYDNDGDYDLFITIGGNEGIGFDYLFRNMWVEDGESRLRFVDVSQVAGIRGPIPPGASAPIPVASANAVWGDVDQDGDVDIFVSVNHEPGVTHPELAARNILWRNNGDGTFTDITDQVGLGEQRRQTRHSAFLDVDNDGDLDLYENNFPHWNILWRNRFAETGALSFEDVTAEFTSLPDQDLRFPVWSFVSAVTDFNNDGWQDLMVFQRLPFGVVTESPYPPGHAIYLNQAGQGFVNVAELSGINSPFITLPGVMGCQVGDVSGNGLPDVYIGNGGPEGGQPDQLFISESLDAGIPHFKDFSALIDFPAPEHPAAPAGSYPDYPYRTHGTNFVDVNNDGLLEITVASGGASFSSTLVREPNRLFTFLNRPYRSYMKVRPVGDGVSVSKDAIGTRFALTVSENSGQPWTIHNTLLAGNGFSAQNGFEVHFGLKNADTVHSLEVTWPNGDKKFITQGLFINQSIVINFEP